jgi:hypothetical protein
VTGSSARLGWGKPLHRDPDDLALIDHVGSSMACRRRVARALDVSTRTFALIPSSFARLLCRVAEVSRHHDRLAFPLGEATQQASDLVACLDAAERIVLR